MHHERPLTSTLREPLCSLIDAADVIMPSANSSSPLSPFSFLL